MTTREAPIALATSKDTSPIGPVEINNMLTVEKAWPTYSCNFKVQILHKENNQHHNKVCSVFTLNLFCYCHKIQLTIATISLTWLNIKSFTKSVKVQQFFPSLEVCWVSKIPTLSLHPLSNMHIQYMLLQYMKITSLCVFAASPECPL